MQKNKTNLLDEIANYYSEKLETHGDTPGGVDWNGEESQTLRFRQLCKIIDLSKQVTINDLGCGYGALYEFLNEQNVLCSYNGIDISENMISAALERYKGHNQARFIKSNTPDQIADFGIASGIFNVRLGHSNEEWLTYIKATLDVLDKTSHRGFSFNCLTSFSDQEKMRDYLYYADPTALFELCKRRYSRNVALLHDYDLYEFTILVRKQA